MSIGAPPAHSTRSRNRLPFVAIHAAAWLMVGWLASGLAATEDEGPAKAPRQSTAPGANEPGSAGTGSAGTGTGEAEVRERCLKILREGMRGSEFWPSIHAAEALTLAGHGDEVRAALLPKLAEETDDQQRCGLARELVRAGDLGQARVMLDILSSANPHGHVHAAESLYKVFEIGDGRALRITMAHTENPTLRLMAAAALGRSGNPAAMAVLREDVKSDDADRARIAAWILARIGDETDVAQVRAGVGRFDDPLVRAYFEHALAALGDPEGAAALTRNLKSDDPAIRTYAATFAGDARLLKTRATLVEMLDDAHLDARLRAAQSWIVLSRPAPPDRGEDISRLVYEASDANPRYTEGSILPLLDGSLLYAVTEFVGSGSDFAKARIVGRVSRDEGRTWEAPRVLQENTGNLNVMSATLRRLAAPAPLNTVGFFYLEKNAYDNLHAFARFSNDDAATFGPAVRVTTEPGYHVLNNDRVTQLRGGRLVVPVAATEDVRKVNHFTSFCYLSDDGGKTWRKGKGQVDLPKRGAMEPEVIELNDDRLMMIMRNQLGTISNSFSSDGGDTWSEPEALAGIKAPEAPATVRRIPSTGDLLLIWNNTYTPGAGHGGKRTPLTAAISDDEGASWKRVKNLESDAARTYSYTSVTFCRGRVVMSYWEEEPSGGRLSSRFRSLPVSWFYQ